MRKFVCIILVLSLSGAAFAQKADFRKGNRQFRKADYSEADISYRKGLLKDKDGNIVVTKLDEQMLRDIARAGGGAYIHAGGEEFGLNPIIQDVRRMEDEEFGSVVFEEYDEQYMYFLGAALLLLVIGMLIGERKPRRRLFEV